VPHPPVAPAAGAPAAVARLLQDLGARLRRGGPPPESRSCLPTGLPELDRLLGGGFPRGRLSEIAGPRSAGRTSLALALLARATAAEEVCALVDAADGFDPASAEAAGVALDRVLWARPVPRPGLSEVLRSTERLLEARGFALVLLDPAGRGREVARSAWSRLARAAAAAGSALVVLSQERAAGPQAEVALEMGALRARFGGSPLLLEAVEIEAALVRHRAAPSERTAILRLEASRAA
jgi:RecA/RadA recombinase